MTENSAPVGTLEPSALLRAGLIGGGAALLLLLAARIGIALLDASLLCLTYVAYAGAGALYAGWSRRQDTSLLFGGVLSGAIAGLIGGVAAVLLPALTGGNGSGESLGVLAISITLSAIYTAGLAAIVGAIGAALSPWRAGEAE